MCRWRIIVGVLLALVVGAPVAGEKEKGEAWDLDNAQSITPVRMCVDGCLRNDEGQPIVHMHFTFVCDVCGTAVEVLIFQGLDNEGHPWTYSAIFGSHKLTSKERSRRNIDTMLPESALRECLRGCNLHGGLGDPFRRNENYGR